MSASYAQDTVLDVKDPEVKKIKVPALEGSDNTHNKLVKYTAYQKVIGAKEKVAMGERSKEKWGCRVNWIVLNRTKVWLAFCFERITLAAVMRKE